MKQDFVKRVKKIFKPAIYCLSIVGIIGITSASANATFASTIENENLTMVRTAEDEKIKAEKQEAIQIAIEESKIVYDGLTMNELVAKLNRNLGSTLTGKGQLFAEYCLEKGVDPYLAVAIVLHETGCKYGCSTLTKQCNNVGGQKGSPSCNGGSYRSYPTIDEGIKGMIDNLYYNYISQGLTTPEAINTKYAESTTWSSKIHSYINSIRAS